MRSRIVIVRSRRVQLFAKRSDVVGAPGTQTNPRGPFAVVFVVRHPQVARLRRLVPRCSRLVWKVEVAVRRLLDRKGIVRPGRGGRIGIAPELYSHAFNLHERIPRPIVVVPHAAEAGVADRTCTASAGRARRRQGHLWHIGSVAEGSATSGPPPQALSIHARRALRPTPGRPTLGTRAFYFFKGWR